MKPITTAQARSLASSLAYAMDGDCDSEIKGDRVRFSVTSTSHGRARSRTFIAQSGFGTVDETTSVKDFDAYMYDEASQRLHISSGALTVTFDVSDRAGEHKGDGPCLPPHDRDYYRSIPDGPGRPKPAPTYETLAEALLRLLADLEPRCEHRCDPQPRPEGPRRFPVDPQTPMPLESGPYEDGRS